jgi:outer membrane lipoprotein carrier protein
MLSYDAVETPMAPAITGALLLALGAGPVATPSAEALVRAIEERHRSLKDLTAQFTQTYRSGMLGREIVERGTVKIKPPGRMLWQYLDPEKKTFVSDGKTFYFYVPADRQVVVRDQAAERGVAVALLAGGRDILGQFEAELENPQAGQTRLRLTPRKPDPDVERVSVEADPAGRIHAIEVLDAQGNRSQFRFAAMRENTGLPDKLFRFEVPRGVEVISG